MIQWRNGRSLKRSKRKPSCVYCYSLSCSEVLISVRLSRRVQKFRADYTELRAQFEQIKAEVCIPGCFSDHVLIHPPHRHVHLERSCSSLRTISVFFLSHSLNTSNRRYAPTIYAWTATIVLRDIRVSLPCRRCAHVINARTTCTT